MSFDYDRMRDAVKNLDAPEEVLTADAQYDLDGYAKSTTRELLRLRRELTVLRDLMWTHKGYLCYYGYDTAANWIQRHAILPIRIIEGDNE